MLTQNATWCQNRGCICISSVRRTYGRIHIPANNNSVDRIISKEEEREDPRRELQSIFEYRIQWCFHNLQELQCFYTQSSKFPVIPCYPTYRINSSTRILQEILQLQGSSRAGSFQQLFPVSPSILHGRIRLPASLQVLQGHTAQAGFQQFYPVETAF